MPIQERMHLMEAIWESFVHDDATSSPAWHKEIIDNRTKLMQTENVKTYSIDELKQQK